MFVIYYQSAGRLDQKILPNFAAAFEEGLRQSARSKKPVRLSMASRPVLQVNGLLPVSEEDSTTPTPTSRDAAKLNMLRRIRPPPLKYAWSFYHDKHSNSDNYEGRLTLMLENIITLKPFWEAFNLFPLDSLKYKDSVHFFKRGVKPVWEDSRNVNGGSWTFRLHKDPSKDFWMEILMMAIGEQFADVIQPGDDLCGMSLSARYGANLITIWNRDGSNQKSIDGIIAVVRDKISPGLMPKEGMYYYKKHSEHAGFGAVIANAKDAKDAELAKAETKVEAESVGEEGLIGEVKDV
ncbi:hypothetical protein MMC12_000952 [Toensbergia leucococca]|nr:hypothetical protein [Toensbergia leucococca]